MVALFTLLPGKACPDTIYLKNGKEFEGHILSEDPGGYTVEIGASVVSLSVSVVERVDKSLNRETSLRELGDLFLRKGEYDMAREYYLRARKTAIDTKGLEEQIAAVDEMMFRSEEIAPADKAFEDGNYRLAADLYSALFQTYSKGACGQELRKKAAEAYCSLAGELTDSQKHGDAVFELSRALELDPANPRIHALAGLVLGRQGRFEAAYQELAMAMESHPLDPLAVEGIELYGRGLEDWMAKRDANRDASGEVINTLEEFLRRNKYVEEQEPSPAEKSLFNVARLGSKAERPGAAYPAASFNPKSISIFLQAYNAGPGAVTLYKGNVPYKETRNYLVRVSKAFDDIVKRKMPASQYDKVIRKYAYMFGFEPDLIRAIVKVESNFNPKCVSTADARGLIQLVRVDWEDSMKRLDRDLDFDKYVFDIEWNLFIGCYYLRWLYDDYLPKAFPKEFS